jgi:hypothetical protein
MMAAQLVFSANSYFNGYPSWISIEPDLSNTYYIRWNGIDRWTLSGWTGAGQVVNFSTNPYPLTGWTFINSDLSGTFDVYIGPPNSSYLLQDLIDLLLQENLSKIIIPTYYLSQEDGSDLLQENLDKILI